MKAALLTGIRRFEVADVPEPSPPGDTDLLIRIKSVGVCGSDIHYFKDGRIGNQVVRFPFTVGHETAGVVERTGKNVIGVRTGDRVALDPAVSCGHCDQCLGGREHTCRQLRFLGCPGQLPGCLCELVVHPRRSCYVIPDHMTFEEAVLSEPLAIALYTVERSNLSPGARVAILGTGPIGMSVLHLLRRRGEHRVYATDRIDARLLLAANLGLEWSGNPDTADIVGEIASREPLLLDCVYECSGDPAAIDQGVRLLKPGGLLVLVGIPEGDAVVLPIHEMRRKEITVITIRRQVHRTQKALDLLAAREVDLSMMVTHRFPLERTQAAFELVEGYRDGVMKAIIYPAFASFDSLPAR